MKRIKQVVLLICALAVLVTCCGVNDARAAGDPITLRWASIESIGGTEYKAMQWLVKEVERRTDGRLKIQYFPASQLGLTSELKEGLELGSLDVFIVGSNIVGDFGPKWQFGSMLYAFSSLEHRKAFNESALCQEREEELRLERGIRVISNNWYRNPHVTLTTRPVLNVGELQGLRMRVPESSMAYKNWAALGTKPVTVAWGETYLGLKQGIAEGVSASFQLIRDLKFNEAAPFITMMNTEWSYEIVMINEKKFQTIPKELQKILIEATNEAGNMYENLCFDKFGEDQQLLLKEGSTIIYVDIAPFRKKIESLVPELEKEKVIEPGWWEKIQELDEE